MWTQWLSELYKYTYLLANLKLTCRRRETGNKTKTSRGQIRSVANSEQCWQIRKRQTSPNISRRWFTDSRTTMLWSFYFWSDSESNQELLDGSHLARKSSNKWRHQHWRMHRIPPTLVSASICLLHPCWRQWVQHWTNVWWRPKLGWMRSNHTFGTTKKIWLPGFLLPYL